MSAATHPTATHQTDWQHFLARTSFIELKARERARSLLDPGSFREIAGPFDRVKSPWLPMQGIVAQADDGVVVARGTIDGVSAVVCAIESAYQGGSMGEVAGTKIAASLEQAAKDNEKGIPTRAVILFETGGVRLQEANLGLEVISEIHSAIVALRKHTPVVGVIAGMVGSFGGMSLAASLASYLIVTPQARIGMNGPEVIEQEAGVEEVDSADKGLIWSLIGGEQRYRAGFADTLVEDDAQAIGTAVRAAFAKGVPAKHRSEQAEEFLARLKAIDPTKPLTGKELQQLWGLWGEEK